MRKVICDICGTAYPENAANCPICGSPREYALGTVEDEFLTDEASSSTTGSNRKNRREIFDFDEVNQVKSAGRALENDDFDDEEVYEEESGTNVGLVIVLVVLIALLLLAAGFFFIRYLLPNMIDKPEDVPVATTAVQQTEPVVTTSGEIPCTNLMMDGGKMSLGKDGKKLLNVRVYPENTTDKVIYTSGDEAVVTVSEDGTVQAVGEGQTIITVQCGAQKIKCNVTVDYTGVDVTVPEGTLPGLQVEEGENESNPTEADGTQPADAAEPEAQATEATEETTKATVPEREVLKLKQKDITISFLRTSVQLDLDCDIPAEDVTWFTMDSGIAIVHEGLVTSMGRGTTKIYAEYKGQQAVCIVRCP